MSDARTHDTTALFRQRMRMPVMVSIALLALLALNMALAVLHPFAWVGYLGIGIAVVMAMIVLFFAMEITQQAPLIQLFSGLGFFWVAILFTLTMVDYLTR
jgi:cytochrome c oxidase subunit 4